VENYTATVEVARKVDPYAVEVDAFDDIMDALSGFHAAVSVSPRGWLTATVTLPADSLAQATTTAAALVERAADAAALAAQVMTTREHDARQGWEPVPELLSVSEAADKLGVSRQAVLDRIKRHTLPASKIGRDYAIPAGAVKQA
jgi:excisionase family DNA binding protein